MPDIASPESGGRHTPGPWKTALSDPWRLENDRTGTCAWIGIKGKRKVVAIVMTTGHHEGPEYQANARLIAAAPDLLEALRYLEALLSEVAPEYRESTVAANARAALARAGAPL